MEIDMNALRKIAVLAICGLFASNQSLFGMKEEDSRTWAFRSACAKIDVAFYCTYILPFLQAYDNGDEEKQRDALIKLDTYLISIIDNQTDEQTIIQAKQIFESLIRITTDFVTDRPKIQKYTFDKGGCWVKKKRYKSVKKMYKKINEVMENKPCFFSIALAFCTVRCHDQELNEALGFKEFINNMPEYLKMKKPQETFLLTQPYLNYVLPIMDFFAQTSITECNLSNKELTEFPLGILQLWKISFIGFSNNNLSDLPEQIKFLSQLQILDLSNNNFTKFLPIFNILLNEKMTIFFDGNHGLEKSMELQENVIEKD